MPRTPSATDGGPAIRFGLRQAFALTTYTAIAIWSLRSCSSSHQIYGAINARLMIGVILTVALVSPLMLFNAKTRFLFGVSMIVLVAFSLYQSMLSWRLTALGEEVAAIIEYVDGYRVDGGPYPKDLSQYRFRRPELARFIEYRDSYPVTSYEIRWHPLPLYGIAHWYSPDFGHYYEDD